MKYKSFRIILSFMLYSQLYLVAQPALQWQFSYGGTSTDQPSSIQQTNDGGYIIAGRSWSIDGDVTSNNGSEDYWIIKLDISGVIQWQRSLGGTHSDGATSIIQSSDGGFIVAGYTFSNDSDVIGNHGTRDGWIIKLYSNGTTQWKKCFGGSDWDVFFDIHQTTDGGYIAAGNSRSNDFDVSGNHGNSDYWIVKLDTVGTIQWQKCLGGSDDEWAESIQQTTEGGYIITGFTSSNDGDIPTGTPHGYDDYWVVKTDSTGLIQWQKCLGGTSNEEAYSIQQTIDGGYIVAGNTSSNNGDVTGIHGIPSDAWIVKLNGVGVIQWQKCLGGTNFEDAQSIIQTNEGGYIFAGFTTSNDSDVNGNHGGYDYWIVKIDTIGNIQWQKCLGGTDTEIAYSIKQTTDNGFIIAGLAGSNNGDVSGNHGNLDYWIVKLSAYVGIEEENSSQNISVFPNPSLGDFQISYNEPINNGLIQVFNNLGERVYQEKIYNESTKVVHLSNISSGVYYLNVEIREESIIQKRIVIIR